MGREIRILLVGADQDMRKLLTACFDREADMRVVGSTSRGAEAVELMDGLSPDVVVIDAELADMDRPGLLERLALMDEDMRPATVTISKYRDRQRPDAAVRPADLRTLAEQIRRSAHLRVAGKPEWAVGTGGEYGLIISATRILRELSVPTHLAGYYYLREAAVMTALNVNLIGAVTKELYPEVAKKFGVAPNQVERAMRTVIEYAWTAADASAIWKYFGPRQSRKPSNSEFISVIADKLFLQRKYVECIK